MQAQLDLRPCFDSSLCPALHLLEFAQGVLIRRHRIEKSDGSFFAPGDFMVGDNVSFYGRTFHIVDADVFTRQTMADAGLEYGPAETYPGDPFTTKKLSTQRHGFGQPLITLSSSLPVVCSTLQS